MTIYEAIARGDEDAVEDWIERGADLDDPPDDATSRRLEKLGVEEMLPRPSVEFSTVPPLHLAAALGRAGIVRRLLAAGADVDAAVFDDTGEEATPLACAAAGDHVEIVDVLLAAGADARQALMGLFLTHDSGILKTLVDAGADLEATYYEGPTLLMAAAGEDDVERVRLLLEAGADPHTRDDYEGGFALSYAATRDAEDAYQELLPFYSEEQVIEAREAAELDRQLRRRRIEEESSDDSLVRNAVIGGALARQMGLDAEDLDDPELDEVLAAVDLDDEAPEGKPTTLMVAAQMGEVTSALAKRTPSAASRSSTGVRMIWFPAQRSVSSR